MGAYSGYFTMPEQVNLDIPVIPHMLRYALSMRSNPHSPKEASNVKTNHRIHANSSR